MCDAETHRTHVHRYENDAGQTCLAYGAKTLWALGYPDQAVDMVERALAVAQATNHVSNIVESTCWRAEISLYRREVDQTREHAGRALASATEHGLPLWTGMAGVMHGWALAKQGDTDAGIGQIRDALVCLASTGDKLFRPYYLSILAQAFRNGGDPGEGLASLDEAIKAYRASGVVYWDSELRRLKGEVFLASGGSAAAAEGCFRQAIEIARRQSAKSLELRAATSLARMWAKEGRRAEAHELLAPVYGWFTEGFETADLKDAKALLDELG